MASRETLEIIIISNVTNFMLGHKTYSVKETSRRIFGNLRKRGLLGIAIIIVVIVIFINLLSL